MSDIRLLKTAEDQSAQWADFAAFYLGLTKKAGLTDNPAIQHFVENAGDYLKLLKSGPGKAVAGIGAIGGGLAARHLAKPREEHGGQSRPEAELAQKLQDIQARGESPSFAGKLSDQSHQTAHGIASAVRKHPNIATGIGAGAGALSGLGLLFALGAGKQKVAFNMGGVGQALSRVNPAGLLGAAGAVTGGLAGAAGGAPGHRLSSAAKGALVGGGAGLAGGTLLSHGGGLAGAAKGAVGAEAQAAKGLTQGAESAAHAPTMANLKPATTRIEQAVASDAGGVRRGGEATQSNLAARQGKKAPTPAASSTQNVPQTNMYEQPMQKYDPSSGGRYNAQEEAHKLLGGPEAATQKYQEYAKNFTPGPGGGSLPSQEQWNMQQLAKHNLNASAVSGGAGSNPDSTRVMHNPNVSMRELVDARKAGIKMASLDSVSLIKFVVERSFANAA